MCSKEVSTKPAEEKLILKFIFVEKYNGNRGIEESGHNAVKYSQVKMSDPRISLMLPILVYTSFPV